MASSPPLAASPAPSISSPISSPPLLATKVRRKPLPEHATPVTSTLYNPSPLSIEGDKPTFIPPPRPESLSSVEADSLTVPRNPNRFSRGRSAAQPLQIDTSANAAFLRSVVEDDDDDEEGADYFDDEYENQFTNGIGTPLHSRLVSEPFIPVLNSPPPTQRRATSMALHTLNQPPPLKIDLNARSMSMGPDPRQPKTPGNKISSFFGWKGNANGNPHGQTKVATSPGGESTSTEISDGGRSPMPSPMPPLANEAMFASKLSDVENELREISSELAGSIRREMELEDLIERLQSEGPDANRRTSDYFSDSGTGSIRNPSDAGRASVEDIEKIRRAAEQERAQLKVEMSQKLQDERMKRTASESHVQILENQVQQLRRDRVENSDLASKTSSLERALEDTKRKLLEERQSKDNFEDLLTAMRVELEQLRNDRDMLRQGKPPPSEMQRLIEEIEALKIENASLAQLQGKRNSIMGLSRSNSLARKPSGLSRSNSVSGREREQQTGESLVDQIKNIEAQRDALHRTLKSLLDRHDLQAREFEKRAPDSSRRPGYEREVQGLREDVNHLRMRAEDALDGKWQCEKNLAGLKMDLDRAEQETSSLRALLEEDNAVLESGGEGFAEVIATSSTLQAAYQQLQADRQQAEASGVGADFDRANQLAGLVQQQLQINSSLRSRLESEINKGERDQKISIDRITALQCRMKQLEDTVLAAQNHAEEEMSRHEDEIRQMKESHNAQLHALSRLDKTTSGDGIPLADAVQAYVLEKRVKDLEKVLREADMEMEEVIGQMNRAQADVAQLQSDRDDALRQTRQLQADIEAERESLRALMG
ncbi:hypothetical protein N7468_001785 [Penicillium chermesinum]|uniref:DUF7603 domain-containing protein n=1 Tax=Penicillium chermesinum TaxID=63820 RepID=A0A9W9TXD8_9EURO|nr:uncharacterized protein N7468_001785 [Penicillium chermesinum]KAJ5246802.1 hypothetical protein N7468_001785 [Penicillium chermesinum]